MEEDNRALHPLHPFRQYQYHRISKMTLTTKNGNGLVVDSHKILTSSRATERRSKTMGDPINLPSLGNRKTATASVQWDSATPITTKQVSVGGDESHTRPILGMTAVDDEIGNASDAPWTTHRNPNTTRYLFVTHSALHDSIVSGNKGLHPQPSEHEPSALRNDHQPQNETPSWIQESKRLFQDYQRRFHRQSLTENAKDLLDRASKLARGKHNSDAQDNDNLVSISLCTKALELCKESIHDQEETLHQTEFIGGSYLLTGDIRIRRKAEAFAAKIHCLRAAVRYQEGLYEESLEDCEAAIAIWTQKTDLRQDKRWFAKKRMAKNESSLPPRKLSHKHLYLLKARVLAAMGRHRDAVAWLAHPQNLPARIFQRSSALLETDVAMNRFLDHHCRGYDRSGGAITNSKPTKTCTQTTVSKPNECNGARIQTNKNLWPEALHTIDRRLNEGMIGSFHVTKKKTRKKCQSGERHSHSGSAIYHLLRHGPVLFHH